MTDETPVPPSPDNYRGPLWLVIIPSFVTAAVTLVQNFADISADVKTIAENFQVGWALPYVAGVLAAGLALLPLVGGLVWYWRRAVSRGKAWALALDARL